MSYLLVKQIQFYIDYLSDFSSQLRHCEVNSLESRIQFFHTWPCNCRLCFYFYKNYSLVLLLHKKDPDECLRTAERKWNCLMWPEDFLFCIVDLICMLQK